VRVTRCAWRADDAPNLYPADAALNLPDRLHSHTPKRRTAIEAVRSSFDAAEQAVMRACGKVAGKRQVEQLTTAATADIAAFYATSVPQPATDDTLLVLSVDGKGVVIRPEALRADPQGRDRQGCRDLSDPAGQRGKQRRKRIATLGTVYDAEPAPRRPHDVLTPAISLNAAGGGDDGGQPRRKGPVATSKWLTGSIATTSEQVTARWLRPTHPA
jgi:hypothetical protein